MDFTHFNEHGRGTMVDVSAKPETERIAVASGFIKMKAETVALIKTGGIKKGDVLGVAQVGGIMGAKKTSEIIPMCHNIFIASCDINFEVDADRINVTATAKTKGQTGIEMEALVAVNTALLTIYDMCKAVDKTMEIGGVMLTHKSGGKSGTFNRKEC